MTSAKWQTYVVVGTCVVIILVVGISIISKTSKQPSAPAVPLTQGVPASSVPSNPSGYVAGVPKGAALTQTVSEAPAAPSATERLRVFQMSASEGGYLPSTITVNKGDIVNIKLTALAGDYDFSMPYTGMYQSVKQGETKQIGFGAVTAGTFTFECRSFCPAGGKITGSVIVLP